MSGIESKYTLKMWGKLNGKRYRRLTFGFRITTIPTQINGLKYKAKRKICSFIVLSINHIRIFGNLP